ncbi:MAG: SpoT [Fibrobacteres bacterium]|nr:SpoT [Fibrobacterota bacterium]
MDKKQGSGKKAQSNEPRAASVPGPSAVPESEPAADAYAVPELVAGEGALPAVMDEPDTAPEIDGRNPGPIPVVAAAFPEDGTGTDLDIKAPEIERSLDRAKENLLDYIGERSPNFNRDLIQRAIDFTMIAHKNQFRRSGMPYAEHPFEVAKLLADLNMDTVTIAAGLLHDVVEDTGHSTLEIKSIFGEEVAFLVEAVTKISAIKSKSRADQQAETFRKMLISMAKDIRVIMIKFADRLHNMRTLNYMQEDRKKAIAAETMEVYSPLAHRFGLAKIKWELEDLAFKHLNPDAYKNLVKKVVEKRLEREEYIRSILGPVKDALKKAELEGKVFGRPKHLYSIWQKMQTRQCTFEDIYDLYALRIIVNSVGDCYGVLGLVHSIWTPLQSRFKDYIATPKSNMYQSLHTTLIGPGGKPIEIQIRTEEMDLIAEQGIAAHWGYKEGASPKELGKENKWLTQFLDWQQDLTDSHEFMEYFRGDLVSGEIYVFTPTGDLIQLPKGATALDFAFALHSEIGLHCIGAKVDGNVVPLHRELKTGERVEILKSDSQRPSKDWLSVVSTTKAKSAIRRWMRTEEIAHSIQLGKEMLEREFRQAHIPPNIQGDFKPFADKFQVQTWEILWEKIGHGEITLGSISTFVQDLNPNRKKPSVLDRLTFKRPPKSENSVLVSGMQNMLIRYATCCHPVPGDKILGYVTRGRGVSIHRSNCPEGMLLMKDQERIIPVQWKTEAGQQFEVVVEIAGKDRPDLLRDITDVFSKLHINVQRASIVTVRDQVRNRFRIQVSDLEQLDKTITLLRKLKGVATVSRRQSGT